MRFAGPLTLVYLTLSREAVIKTILAVQIRSASLVDVLGLALARTAAVLQKTVDCTNVLRWILRVFDGEAR